MVFLVVKKVDVFCAKCVTLIIYDFFSWYLFIQKAKNYFLYPKISVLSLVQFYI